MPSNYSWRGAGGDRNQTPDIEPHIYKLRHIQDSTRSTATQTAAPRRPESDLWDLQNTMKITVAAVYSYLPRDELYGLCQKNLTTSTCYHNTIKLCYPCL